MECNTYLQSTTVIPDQHAAYLSVFLGFFASHQIVLCAFVTCGTKAYMSYGCTVIYGVYYNKMYNGIYST